jgi:D-alanine-D-alanine ligase
MKKNIAVIAGGFSKEAEVSRKGAKVVEKNLDRSLYNVYVIYITKTGWYHLTGEGKKIVVDKNYFSLTIRGKKIRFHCVFTVIHGTPGEDGKLQGYFDILGIPYINSNLTVSAITFNKYFTGIIAEYFGALIPKSVLIRKGEKPEPDKIINKLGLPCFVKPNKGGSSIGVTKVTEKDKLKGAIDKAFKADDEVLIEEFIDGKEISCGVIKSKNKIIALPITEIVPKNDYFDYEAKYAKGKSEEITPARIEKEVEVECKRVSMMIYERLGCKGMVRMDYIINKLKVKNEKLKINYKMYLLDINTVPGLSEASLIPKQAKEAGISLKELYNLVINQCFIK